MKFADSINVGDTHGPCIQGHGTWCHCRKKRTCGGWVGESFTGRWSVVMFQQICVSTFHMQLLLALFTPHVLLLSS